MICWEAVTLDCLGGQETMGTYRHESAYIRVVGTQPCDPNDPAAGTCPSYLRESFVTLQETADRCVREQLLPGVGEVLLMKVTAIDAAGNEDCG